MVEDKMYMAEAGDGGRQEGAEDDQEQGEALARYWGVSVPLLAVTRLKVKHAKTWREEPETYWFRRLVEEICELSDALDGTHEHTPDVELMQIAAICLNWLEMREEKQHEDE